MSSPAKTKHRFVMTILPEDYANLEKIVLFYRQKAGFDVKIAEIQRRLWKDEVARIEGRIK
jgi:hypothetical protein